MKESAMKLIWLTDIHLDHVRNVGHYEKFLDEIRAHAPKVILIGGDTGEAHTWRRHVESISDIAPTYFVLGNHDYYGGTIQAVEEEATAFNKASWLGGKVGSVILTEDTALVGEGGWGDALAGDAQGSEVELNDWRLIQDPAWKTKTSRVKRLKQLGKATAKRLDTNMRAALTDASQLIVLTHVPPWTTASCHEGQHSDKDWAPWFVWEQGGRVIEKVASEHPRANILVLCGHTHSAGISIPCPGVTCVTGKAAYGLPEIQDPIWVR